MNSRINEWMDGWMNKMNEDMNNLNEGTKWMKIWIIWMKEQNE
jgi:hypothetical protein